MESQVVSYKQNEMTLDLEVKKSHTKEILQNRKANGLVLPEVKQGGKTFNSVLLYRKQIL